MLSFVIRPSVSAPTICHMTSAAHNFSSGGRILIVGTANMARSAFAEQMLTEGLEGTGIEVISCGTDAVKGGADEMLI